MTLILDLPPGVQETLTREAVQRGTTPEALALMELGLLFPAERNIPAPAEASNLWQSTADVIAWWKAEGAFLSPDEYADRPDSPELARQIREAAWRRS